MPALGAGDHRYLFVKKEGARFPRRHHDRDGDKQFVVLSQVRPNFSDENRVQFVNRNATQRPQSWVVCRYSWVVPLKRIELPLRKLNLILEERYTGGEALS